MELNNLALKHVTDKNMSHHGFVKYYEDHFKDFRNKEINLLEIGVHNGGSVRMWKDYFPKANITGVDILPRCKKYEEERIKILIGDQGDNDFIHSIEGQFDIIIDDGSHRWKHQIDTFEILFSRLKNGGVYVIEDLYTSVTPSSVYNTGDKTCLEFLYELATNLTKSRNRNVTPTEYESIHFYKSIAFICKS